LRLGTGDCQTLQIKWDSEQSSPTRVYQMAGGDLGRCRRAIHQDSFASIRQIEHRNSRAVI
jgi:hypothetical protein